MNKDEQIIDAVSKHPLSMADAAKHCELSFGTFKYRATKLGLYNPNQGGKGRKSPNKGKAYNLADILNGTIEYKAPSSLLKQRLLDEGYKEDVCEECGQRNIWNNKPLTLQLDHIDGDHTNNKIENLRIMCPNCHTQTETHGKQKGIRKHRHLGDITADEIKLHADGCTTVTELCNALGLNKNSSSVRSKLKQFMPK